MNCDYMFQLKLAIIKSNLYLLIPRTVNIMHISIQVWNQQPTLAEAARITCLRHQKLKIHLAESHFRQLYDHLLLYWEVCLKHIMIC